jgi:hypothetical protein
MSPANDLAFYEDDQQRFEDLGPGDLVRVECAACGHDVLIPPSALLHGLRLAPTARVLELESRLRCRECDAKGKGGKVD